MQLFVALNGLRCADILLRILLTLYFVVPSYSSIISMATSAVCTVMVDYYVYVIQLSRVV